MTFAMQMPKTMHVINDIEKIAADQPHISKTRELLERGNVNSPEYQAMLNNGSLDAIVNFCKETVNFFKTAGEVLEKIIWCIANPLDALGKLWDGIVACSFWFAVLSVVILMLYNAVADNPKTSRWISYIIVTYILIKAINRAI